MAPTIVLRQGNPMPLFMRVLAGIIAFIALFMFPLGLVLTLICILALSYSGGVEIDPTHRRLREYGGVLGIRNGSWKPLDPFTQITVLKVQRSGVQHGRSGSGTDVTEQNFDVCLLTADHRRKLLLRACDEREEAFRTARSLAEQLSMDLVAYAPPRSSGRRR